MSYSANFHIQWWAVLKSQKESTFTCLFFVNRPLHRPFIDSELNDQSVTLSQ